MAGGCGKKKDGKKQQKNPKQKKGGCKK